MSIVMLAVALGLGAAQPGASQPAQTGRGDPLPSWNDGAAKRGIIDFVTRVTREGGPDFVPVGIDRQIGKRPIFVAGNVGNYGDIAMMQYSKGRRGPSFQLLINHDDAAREFAYGEKDNASLNAAKKYGFAVASVKNDWKTVFVAGQAAVAK